MADHNSYVTISVTEVNVWKKLAFVRIIRLASNFVHRPIGERQWVDCL